MSGASDLWSEVSTALDWGIRAESETYMDANAGDSTGSCRGLGKAKHIDTQYHWVQEHVAQTYSRIKTTGAEDMLADVLTKPVAGEKMYRALLGMNFHFPDGRHQLSLKKWDGLCVATTSEEDVLRAE